MPYGGEIAMEELIKIENVKKYYTYKKGIINKKEYHTKAVDMVSFSIFKGETLGIVGESGCGKSTLARLLLKLTEPTDSKIIYRGNNILKFSGKTLREYRKKIGMVFQDPASSLNPRSTIWQALRRQLIINGIDKSELDKIIIKTIKDVGLDESFLDRYPHQLSGGQQQRVSIARAIILKPEFLILDEPTSALDVSVQAQILNLLLDIQKEYNLTYFFITHNLHVVRYISDRIGVMYLGKLVELGTIEEIYNNPAHPYTYGLLSASPILSPIDRGRKKFMLVGEPPSAVNPPEGCRLHPRCPYKISICEENTPELMDIGKNHRVACHRIGEINF